MFSDIITLLLHFLSHRSSSWALMDRRRPFRLLCLLEGFIQVAEHGVEGSGSKGMYLAMIKICFFGCLKIKTET